jgi:hypothetical protein
MSAPSAGEKDPNEPIELLDDDSDDDNDVPQAVRAGDVIVLGNGGRVIFLDSDDEVIEIDDSEEKITAHAAQQDDESAKSDRDGRKLPAVVASKQEPCSHAEDALSSDDAATCSESDSKKLPAAVASNRNPCAHAEAALSSDDASAISNSNDKKLPAPEARQQGLCSQAETPLSTEAPEQRVGRQDFASLSRANGVPIRKSNHRHAWDCDEDEIVAPGDASGQGDSGDDHPKTDFDSTGLCAQHQEQLVFHLNTEFEWRQNQQRSVRATYVVRFQCGLLLLRTPLLFPFGAPMSYRQWMIFRALLSKKKSFSCIGISSSIHRISLSARGNPSIPIWLLR